MAEIEGRYEAAASECERLGSETDALLESVREAQDGAKGLADRMQLEAQEVRQGLTALADRLEAERDGLAGKAMSARKQMDALREQAHQVEDRVQAMLDAVGKAMARLEDEKTRLSESPRAPFFGLVGPRAPFFGLVGLRQAQHGTKGGIEALARSIRDLQEHAAEELDQAELMDLFSRLRFLGV